MDDFTSRVAPVPDIKRPASIGLRLAITLRHAEE